MSIVRHIAEKPLRDERTKNDYARLSIDLGAADMVGTNIQIQVHGDKVAKIKYDGSDTGTYFTFDHRNAAKVYASEFKSANRRFNTIWLTNPNAQTGKVLILQLNEMEVSEIEPDVVTQQAHLAEIEAAVETVEEVITTNDVAWVPVGGKVAMLGGHFDDAATDIIDEGDAGCLRINATHELYTIVRDGLGGNRSAKVDAGGQLGVLDTDCRTALQLIDDAIKADDAAFVPGTTKVMMLGAEADETTPDSVDEGDAGALRMTLDRKLHVKNTGLEAIQAVDGGGDLQKVKEELEKIAAAIKTEDVAYSSGDKGIMALACREDTDTVMAGSNGDYIPLSVNELGHLRVDAKYLSTIDADTGAIKTAIEKIDDWDDADHAKVVPPLHSAKEFLLPTDAGSTTIPAPGAGYALEVLGYQITEHEEASLAITTQASIKFATSGIYVWRGIAAPKGGAEVYKDTINGIRVRGAANEALTITNIDRSAGGSRIIGVVFYRTVTV